MASTSPPPLSETYTESQPHSPPENSRVKTYSLPEGPIPDFDWKALRPAVPKRKIDVSKRVEELRKYLRENTYPAHQKNIITAIEMYNQKELPKPNTHCVYIQDGKLTELNVDCLQRTGLIWMEGYQFQLMQAHGHHHQPQPQQPSTVFGYNHALGGAEIVMRIVLSPAYGGYGPPLIVRALNDTGSSIMTLFYNEALNMGWRPALFPAQLVEISSVDAVTSQEAIYVLAQVCDYNGSLLTGWFAEQVVLRHFTEVEVRLSGSSVRNQLYIGTAPGLPNLYVARTKTHLSRILPNLNQLPQLR